MEDGRLDEIDEAILHILQEDARRTLTEIAADLPVSSNTVSNRIQALEDAGIIQGYLVDVDYSNTEYPLHYQFSCTVSISDRGELADEALGIAGVVEVTERMTGERNLTVRAIARDQDDITRIAENLDDLGITVVDETVIRRRLHQPLGLFENEFATED